MPGHQVPQIKYEPQSDEEDDLSHETIGCVSQLVMPNRPLPQIKYEPQSDEEDDLPHGSIGCEPQRDPFPFIKLEPNGGPAHHIHMQPVEVLETMSPAAPAATPVAAQRPPGCPEPALLQTLEPQSRTMGSAMNMDDQIMLRSDDSSEFVPLMIKDEPLSEGEQQQYSGEDTNDSCSMETSGSKPAKSWTQNDMDNALEALRSQNMSLTKASSTFGIPSTTLWQRAHRLGIDTPKKEGGAKSWSSHTLKAALHALRAGALSANKASKAYGIPSSTLYKIARREGIRLSAPFNAAPTSWSANTLARALHDIRTGRATVQRAAQHYGIPTGTLYGRCKREGIELSRSNPTPWSEDAMGEALEAVRVGQMSINQAAIHYNLPYSSLYGRFKRCKYQVQPLQPNAQEITETDQTQNFYPQPLYQNSHTPEQIHHYPTQIPVVTEIDIHNPLLNIQQNTDLYTEQDVYYGASVVTTS